MNKIKVMSRFGGFALSLLATSMASAFESLTEGEMAEVAGQSGLTLNISSPAVTASKILYCVDSSTLCQTSFTGANASALVLNDFSLRKVGLNGANPGVGNLTGSLTLDAGSTAVTGGTSGMAISATWDRTRMQIGQLQNGNITQSTGTFVLDSSGSFILSNIQTLFRSGSTGAKLYLAINDADLFWRQGGAGSPELTFNNIDFLWDMPSGTVGFDSNGLLIQGDVNFNLTFDLRYEYAPTSSFTIGTNAQDIPAVRYGWSGGLSDARVTAGPGGSWNAATALTGTAPNQLYARNVQANRTEGITLSMRWNLQPDFRVVLGYVAAPAAIEFGDWVNLPATAQPPSQPALTTYGFDIPLLAIDMLRAGQGPGGLCWGANWEGPQASCEAAVHGGQFLNLAAEDHSLALLIRDGFLRAYSSSVKIIDPPNPTETYNWALIYTLGNIDGNIYFRPDTRTPASVGVKADILVMSQTFDVFDADGDNNTWEQGPNWGYGTHFMIADTDADLGIGLVNASFLLAGDNQYINLISSGVSIGDATVAGSPVRWHVRGQLAGGDIPNMNDMVQIANWDGNFEFDRFNLTLSPPAVAGETYVGYEFTARFANTNIAQFSQNTAGDSSDDGSYLSLSDPGRPTKDIRLADIQGWYAARNGRLQLKSDSDTPVGVPAQLILQNDLLIGASVPGVGATSADVFRISRVEFENRDLGSIVIPSGQWYLGIGLQPK
ncbi:MAG: hypothetical protein V4729_12300 [Pseudomonadota bacterium]